MKVLISLRRHPSHPLDVLLIQRYQTRGVSFPAEELRLGLG